MAADTLLSRLRAAHEAATPGPWRDTFDKDGNNNGEVYAVDGYDDMRSVADVRGDRYDADARLVCLARNALPALLDVAEAAEEAERAYAAFLAAELDSQEVAESARHDRALVRLRAALARLGEVAP